MLYSYLMQGKYDEIDRIATGLKDVNRLRLYVFMVYYNLVEKSDKEMAKYYMKKIKDEDIKSFAIEMEDYLLKLFVEIYEKDEEIWEAIKDKVFYTPYLLLKFKGNIKLVMKVFADLDEKFITDPLLIELADDLMKKGYKKESLFIVDSIIEKSSQYSLSKYKVYEKAIEYFCKYQMYERGGKLLATLPDDITVLSLTKKILKELKYSDVVIFADYIIERCKICSGNFYVFVELARILAQQGKYGKALSLTNIVKPIHYGKKILLIVWREFQKSDNKDRDIYEKLCDNIKKEYENVICNDDSMEIIIPNERVDDEKEMKEINSLVGDNMMVMLDKILEENDRTIISSHLLELMKILLKRGRENYSIWEKLIHIKDIVSPVYLMDYMCLLSEGLWISGHTDESKRQFIEILDKVDYILEYREKSSNNYIKTLEKMNKERGKKRAYDEFDYNKGKRLFYYDWIRCVVKFMVKYKIKDDFLREEVYKICGEYDDKDNWDILSWGMFEIGRKEDSWRVYLNNVIENKND